jgi:plasmid stabilization system protein ParE
MREIIIRPATEGDILDAALWYEARSSGLGSDFIRAVDVCLAAVARAPEQYPLVRRDARRVLMRRFPYAVYFVASELSVEVVACMHVRRDPRRWQER